MEDSFEKFHGFFFFEKIWIKIPWNSNMVKENILENTFIFWKITLNFRIWIKENIFGGILRKEYFLWEKKKSIFFLLKGEFRKIFIKKIRKGFILGKKTLKRDEKDFFEKHFLRKACRGYVYPSNISIWQLYKWEN